MVRQVDKITNAYIITADGEKIKLNADSITINANDYKNDPYTISANSLDIQPYSITYNNNGVTTYDKFVTLENLELYTKKNERVCK